MCPAMSGYLVELKRRCPDRPGHVRVLRNPRVLILSAEEEILYSLNHNISLFKTQPNPTDKLRVTAIGYPAKGFPRPLANF